MELAAKKFDELSAKEVYEILKSRAEIFVVEQQTVYMDMDDIDYDCLHCFFYENERVVAYLRAFYKKDAISTVKIGRVLTLEHGNGTGRELLEKSLPVIKEKMPCDRLCIDAQTHAVGFYEKFGFKVISDEFPEDGIMHVAMELKEARI